MYQNSDPQGVPYSHVARRPRTSVVRTYQEISEILAQRGLAPISPTRVKHECLKGEQKLVRAMLADPLISQLLDGEDRS